MKPDNKTWIEDFKWKFLTMDGRGWVFKNNVIATEEGAENDVIEYINNLLATQKKQIIEEIRQHKHKGIIIPIPSNICEQNRIIDDIIKSLEGEE